MVSRTLLLRSRPAGLASADNFLLVEARLQEKLDTDQVLVKVEYLSVGPRTYAAMRNQGQRLGETIPAYGVGTVVQSGSSRFAKGDQVVGFFGTQEYAVVYLREISKLPAGAKAVDYITKYGLEALTAYFGIKKYADLKPGCVVAVSGAGGAVGSAAVQIAKHLGAQVVGIASSETNCQYLKDILKVDLCAYEGPNLTSELQSKHPKGIDIFIDTKGGSALNSVLPCMKTFGRVVLCGSLHDIGIRQGLVQVT